MKALTLTQPWATLVAIGAKTIETRSWNTNYRGPLAIHAAKTIPGWAAALSVQEPFESVLVQAGISEFPIGCVLATCRLIGVRRMPPSFTEAIEHPGWEWVAPSGREFSFPLTEQERAFGDYMILRYAWLLADVQPLPAPVPARGQVGLWEWDNE